MAMSISLRQRLNELASAFASQLLAAIRGAPLEELVADSTSQRPGRPIGRSPAASSPRKAGRLPRRSESEIADVIERVVSLLRQNPKGLRAEQIRKKLSLQAKELPRPLKDALDSGRLSKSGQKRATVYVAKGGAGARVGRRVSTGAAAARKPVAHKSVGARGRKGVTARSSSETSPMASSSGSGATADFAQPS
jgi:hypothetical protein